MHHYVPFVDVLRVVVAAELKGRDKEEALVALWPTELCYCRLEQRR